MPEANILSVVDGHHVTNSSTVNDLLDLDHRWELSEHVTDSQHHSAALTLSCNLLTISLRHCHGLLYQDMVTQLSKGNCRILEKQGLLYFNTNYISITTFIIALFFGDTLLILYLVVFILGTHHDSISQLGS